MSRLIEAGSINHRESPFELIADGEKYLRWDSVNGANFSRLSSGHGVWLREKGKSMKTEGGGSKISEVWRAYCAGELTQEYHLDSVLTKNGLSERRIKGESFVIKQFSPMVRLGKEWRMAALVVVPKNMESLVRPHPAFVFYKSEMVKSDRERLGKLIDGYAGAVLTLHEETVYRGEKTLARSEMYDGRRRRRLDIRKPFGEIVTAKYGGPTFRADNEHYYTEDRVASVASNGEIVEYLLKKGVEAYVPLVRRVSKLAGGMANSFLVDFKKGNENEPDFNERSVRRFSEKVGESWVGALLDHYQIDYKNEAGDYLLGKRSVFAWPVKSRN
ncbi:hypothetical protein KKD37_01090 [Patescibacteria group bacterium]|nr:hypothetical protein [Patescibacteria group bacterium]